MSASHERVSPLPDLPSSSRYRTLMELGRGGMARVYLAVRIGSAGFRRLCVLKRMHPHLLQSDEFLKMFLREARLAARLNHPNIVNTEEVGQDADGHFMAMEYLEGQSYQALLAKAGRTNLPFGLSVRILIEVLKGLEYAHTLTDFDGTPMQVVHRDLSPSNLFLTYDGRIKILDFGIAKVLDSSNETQAGVIKGKVNYMAPEQLRAEPVSVHSDLYAIGVQLWEAAAGRRRWQGLPETAVLRYLISGKPPESPGAVAQGLPPLVDSVCLRALAVDPRERFASAAELRLALEGLLESLTEHVDGELVGVTLAKHFQSEWDQHRSDREALLKRLELEESISISWQNHAISERPPRPVAERPGASARTKPVPAAAAEASHVTVASVWRAKRRWLLAVSGVAALLLTGAALWRPSKSASPSLPPQPSGTTIAQSKTARAVYHVSIAASPPSAVITVDGNRLPMNPSEVEATDRQELEIRVEAPGCETEHRRILVTGSTSVNLELKAIPAMAEKPPNQSVVSYPKAGVGRVPGQYLRSPAPTTAPPSAPAAAPMAPQRAKGSGVSLDTDNPWKN